MSKQDGKNEGVWGGGGGGGENERMMVEHNPLQLDFPPQECAPLSARFGAVGALYFDLNLYS